MKLTTLDIGLHGHPAALLDSGEIVDLALLRTRLPRATLIPSTVAEILGSGAEGLALVRGCLDAVSRMGEAARAGMRDDRVLWRMDEASFLAPVPRPQLVLSAAANYGKHVKEFSSVPIPRYPTAFIKTTDSLSGHRKPIVVPAQFPERVDYEGEMCFVFGKTCHNVSESQAMDHVAGYMVANDVSARDWVPEVFAAEERFETIRAWERNVMGKNLPGFTPCGPFITTADEIRDPQALSITTTLNGQVMQSGSTEELLYGVAQLIAYFSQWYRFQPGDIFTTGSPAGVGVGRKPQVFMKPGDLIEVEIGGLGKLSNRLEAAGAQA